MRPPYVVCAASLEIEKICIWEAGAALVTRDVWGRWQLVMYIIIRSIYTINYTHQPTKVKKNFCTV